MISPKMQNILGKILLFAGLALGGHLVAYFVVHIPTQLEILILLGVLFFVPIVRNPQVGIYLVFITAPLITFFRRLYYLRYERPAFDPLIALTDLFLGFLLIGLYFEFRQRGEKDRPMRGYIVALLVYFFYLILRVFFFNIYPAGEALLSWKFYGPPVLFFFIGMVYAPRLSFLKGLWVINVLIGVVAALYAIKQLYLGYSHAEQVWFTSISFTSLYIHGIARPFSFFQAPAAFADYTLLAVIAILMIVDWGRDKVRYLLLLLIPLLSYGVLITSVRSSWMGLISVFLVWLMLRLLKGIYPRLGLLVVLVLLYLGYQVIADRSSLGESKSAINMLSGAVSQQQYLDLLVTDRMSAVTNPFEEHSLLSRVALWQEILSYSLSPVYAFIGRGVGALRADSLYFTYLAEFGYPGLIFIVSLMALFIVRGIRTVDTARNRDIIGLTTGITVMNLVFAQMSITGTHIHSFPGDIYFWFWNGVLIKYATDTTFVSLPDLHDDTPAHL